ncbi:MAG: hypothetical protein ACP5O6_04010 [Candidatus Baltobacteraceae bacterium]
MLGYSDVTAPLNAFAQRAGAVAFQGAIVDRLLTQLRLAGACAGAAGFATGDLEHFDVVAERLGGLGIPATCGFPFGHLDEQWLLPLGLEVELDATAEALRFAQSGVS